MAREEKRPQDHPSWPAFVAWAGGHFITIDDAEGWIGFWNCWQAGYDEGHQECHE